MNRGVNGLRLIAFVSLLTAPALWAGPRETCYRMHSRLTGIPPTPEFLQECADLVTQSKNEEAVLKIMDHDFFYSDTLRSMFSPWSNKAQDKLADLNDLVATAIGLVRDSVDFREILTSDLKYTCNGVTPAYANNSNDHYEACQNNPSLKTVLLQQKQSELDPQLANKTSVPAGVLTSRTFAEGYFDDGTNRAGVRFSLLNFLCEDMPSFQDNTIPDFRVRQDVDRAPGGQAKAYVNECKGCHAGMDALAGAFAYVDYSDNQLKYSEPTVQRKYFRNDDTFPQGFRSKDDGWQNLWLQGQNARVGWSVTEGKGIKDFGAMLANSDQFARCMAKTVYKKVCIEDLDLKHEIVKELGDKFRKSNYNMKSLFAQTAIQCVKE